MREPVQALIALGGNVGDVAAAMQGALDRLHAHSACRVLSVSGVYATPPWGIVDQPDFLNACAALSTTLSPHALLDLILETERAAGRVRGDRWGPRTLDIDILTYGDETIGTERLTVPHARMFERGFVIVPLADIAADQAIAGVRVADIAAVIDRSGISRAQAQLQVPEPV